MPFRRAAHAATPSHDALTARLVGIGMGFAAEGNPAVEIESTLMDASRAGMDDGDLRVLSVLTAHQLARRSACTTRG